MACFRLNEVLIDSIKQAKGSLPIIKLENIYYLNY